MAVTSLPMGGTPNWYCARCHVEFYDADGDRPCPRCRQTDELEEVSPVVAQARAVMQQQKPAPTAQSAPKGVPSYRVGRVVALFALAVGVPFWLEGGRTTRDGGVLGVNWILNRLHVPFTVPDATVWPWWLALTVLVLIGFGFSRIEVLHSPVRWPPNLRSDFFKLSAWRFEPRWEKWSIWIVLIIIDVGTMYLGARSPRESDPAILWQIAASLRAAAIYAMIITFVPDRLIVFGWKHLRG